MLRDRQPDRLDEAMLKARDVVEVARTSEDYRRSRSFVDGNEPDQSRHLLEPNRSAAELMSRCTELMYGAFDWVSPQRSVRDARSSITSASYRGDRRGAH